MPRLLKFFIMLLFCSSVFAISVTFYCPTVNEIKNNLYPHWLPLYVDLEELASDADVNNFKLHITTFSKAEWNPLYLESGRCIYERDDSQNNIVLSRDAWSPVENEHWQWLQKKIAACDSTEVVDCGFLE